MKKSKLIKISLLNSVSAALYISIVSFLMANGARLFGGANGIFGGIAILLLFVISATVVGSLVLGRSVLLYLDGLKKEALKLFYLTVFWLVLIAILVFTGLAIF